MADDDVPPLEDMTAVLKQAEAIREHRESSNYEKKPESAKAKARAKVNKKVNAQAVKPDVLSSGDSVPQKSESTLEATQGKPTQDKTEVTKKKPQNAGGFGGMKKGFLFGGPPASKAKPSTKNADANSSSEKSQKTGNLANQATSTKAKQNKEEIPYIKANGKTESGLTLDEVQAAMTETKGLLDNQEWITDDLLNKVEGNEMLLKRFADPHFMKALEEFQTNPTAAMEKYKGNTEVEKFLLEFCGLLGDHFTNIAGSIPSTGQSPAAPQPMKNASPKNTTATHSTECVTTNSSQGPKIVEITDDDSSQSTKSTPLKGPKIVDLTEQDSKSSAKADIKVTKPQNSKKSSADIRTRTQTHGADIQEVPAGPVGDAEVKQMLSDPKVMEILMDPKIMELIQMLRSDPLKAQRYVDEADKDLKGKVRFLVSKGLLQFQAG